jgi:hypothetical protein
VDCFPDRRNTARKGKVRSHTKNGSGEFKKKRIRFFSSISADRHAIIFCSHVLLPQMKKYRCLWGKSRINHNILYFVRVPDTLPKNGSNCLWKAQNVLARRGLQHPILPRN